MKFLTLAIIIAINCYCVSSKFHIFLEGKNATTQRFVDVLKKINNLPFQYNVIFNKDLTHVKSYVFLSLISALLGFYVITETENLISRSAAMVGNFFLFLILSTHIASNYLWPENLDSDFADYIGRIYLVLWIIEFLHVVILYVDKGNGKGYYRKDFAFCGQNADQTEEINTELRDFPICEICEL